MHEMLEHIAALLNDIDAADMSEVESQIATLLVDRDYAVWQEGVFKAY